MSEVTSILAAAAGFIGGVLAAVSWLHRRVSSLERQVRSQDQADPKAFAKRAAGVVQRLLQER